MPYKKIVIKTESVRGTAVKNTHWRIGKVEYRYQPPSFATRMRECFKNWLVSFGEYLIKIGGG